MNSLLISPKTSKNSNFIFLLQALVGFSDFQIFQELIKGKEDDTFYKNCVSQMLRLVTEDGCVTQKQVLIFLGQRFRVKLNLPDWYSNERVGEFLFKYVQLFRIRLNRSLNCGASGEIINVLSIS